MRWKCTVAYDGTDFEGWQAQPSGQTVQQHIERRLTQLFEQPVRIHGSGRTDSGVHAVGQVFHFDGAWGHGPDALLRALRAGFPDSILVSGAEVVEDAFHARFSAVGKRYVYRLFEGYAPPFETRYAWSLGNRRVSLEAINEAGRGLLGRHDFSAFGANLGDPSTGNPVKDLRVLEVTRDGPRLLLVTEASGYLYKMVRTLTGCLVDVGLGKLTPGQLLAIRESGKRTPLVTTAPARGLALERVYYP